MRLMKSVESLVRRTSGDVAEETLMKHSAQAFRTPHTLSEQSWKKRGSCTGKEHSAGKENQKKRKMDREERGERDLNWKPKAMSCPSSQVEGNTMSEDFREFRDRSCIIYSIH